MTATPTEASYDEVPYPCGAFPQTHPSRLAALATLWGMQPASPARCRILELGCGDGGNIIPMASRLPDATVVGVDLSAREVADGQARIARLGLSNITLHVRDILDLGTDLGRFDYIIAHGVYSWVPPGVQDALLAACSTHLAPGGVAYVSFNALPGGRMRQMLRDMMLFHTRDMTSPARRVDQARSLMDFLANATEGQSSPYARLLRDEREVLSARASAAVLHDDLGAFNEALYFTDFMHRAAAHGLAYLTDAVFSETQTVALPQAVRTTLAGFHGRLDQEQYLDFVKGRSFRHTLLVKKGERVAHPASASRGTRLHVRARAFPVDPAPDLAPEIPVDFKNHGGVTMAMVHPLVKATMLHLARVYPASVPWRDLPAAARAILGQAPPRGTDTQGLTVIGEALLTAYACDMVEVHAHAAVVATEPGERPRADALVRDQAARGTTVTDPWHGTVEINDDLARVVLARLDGTRDRSALAAELAQGATAPFPGQDFGQRVEQALARLAALGLLTPT